MLLLKVGDLIGHRRVNQSNSVIASPLPRILGLIRPSHRYHLLRSDHAMHNLY
jgi:hypothetical protein